MINSKNPIYLKQRFIDKTYPEPNTGCWIWGGWMKSNRYGKMLINNKVIMTHRVSAHLFLNFDLNSSKIICHKCNNPYCVNPDHLYIGTHAMNTQQAFKQGRMNDALKKPRRINQLTLNGEFIREFYSAGEAARTLGINQGNITLVCQGKKKRMYGYKWEYAI